MFPVEFSPFDLKSYRVTKTIGKGEFGKVFLATDKNQFQVAIKEISKQQLRISRKRQELFETERTILVKVKNENVVRMYEHFETPEYHYLVMEYCKYGDLYDYIKLKPNSTLSEEEAVDFLMQILNGFKGLHEILVIHRDIKLRNILVAENDRIKIADFGLSKISEQGVATTIVGTPYTKAPEVFSGKKYDNKADIWSLGVIFYQMLFRLSYPYTAKNQKALFDNIKQGKTINFNAHEIRISDDVEDLIKRMLTPDPKKRITWRQISQHKVIVKYNQKTQKDMSKVFNPDYYEKIEKYMEDYNEINIKLLLHFGTLLGLQKARERNSEFRKINTIYYEYLLSKWMKALYSRVRDVIQTCLQISSIEQALNEDDLKFQEQEIDFYHEQALSNLELYMLERNLQGTVPEIEQQVLKAVPDQRLFHSYSMRLYRILESKIPMFQDVPILQKVILQQMRNILFTLQGYESEFTDTVDGLTQLNKELYARIKNFD